MIERRKRTRRAALALCFTIGLTAVFSPGRAEKDKTISTPAPAAYEAAGELEPETTGEPEEKAPAIPPATATPVPTALPPAGGVPAETHKPATMLAGMRYTADFEYLRRLNGDTVGWLFQEGTGLNQPVTQGKDNTEYANHTFGGRVYRYGSVFLDFENAPDFSQTVSYVYGNSSGKGCAFASLAEYTRQEYADAHPSLRLLTPSGDYQVELFAGVETALKDEDTWRVRFWEDEGDFDAWLAELCGRSLFTAGADALPEWGDRLLVLVTGLKAQSGTRYALYGRMRPVGYESSLSAEVNKLELDALPTGNGYVNVGPLGRLMVYAQNDELWSTMRYESGSPKKFRNFGQGGCGPTAVAMAVANLVEKDELTKLVGYAGEDVGFTFCTCSVNRLLCNQKHVQYRLRTADEMLRYLPVAMAGFASGNNIWNLKSRKTTVQGTDMRFLDYVGMIYGLSITKTRRLSEAVDMLREGGCMVVSCTTVGGPFTKNGHYVVLAGVDDEYLYVLDPYRRKSYEEMDRHGIVEILSPGVVRVPLERAGVCNLSPLYILKKPEK